MPGDSKKRNADFLHRLLLRGSLLLLPPVLAAILRYGANQVIFCTVCALLWCLLEASIIYRVPLSAGCRKLPFVLRLLAAYCLDIQACWLLGSSDRYQSAEALGVNVNTLSIVLPCANESEFVIKTIRAVFEATPSEQLQEIIVVDDASRPVISQDIDATELENHRARIIRHDIAQGLIRSKKHGADSAKGDIIVFLDCHVKPIAGWTEDLFDNIRENPKRVVVPTISSLDPETWEETNSAGGRKMCLTWNADFYWCNGYPGPYVPIMSGGLLALSRYWWETTGGYDGKMQAWGGENLDQSLRTWLCGGEIVVARTSRVAHMWRDPSKPKTVLHYSIPTEHVLRNRLRAATSWMGDWAKKVRSFPEYTEFNPGGHWDLGTFENVQPYHDQLQCQDFKWYLDKFQDLYSANGALPKRVFNLRDTASQLCLHHELTYQSNQNGKMVLRPCNRFSEAQRWHEANAVHNHRSTCCSGIKLWDIDICLAASQVGSEPHAEMCFNFGESSSQWMQKTEGGQLQWRHGEGCIVPGTHSPEEKAKYWDARAEILRGSQCESHIQTVSGDSHQIRLVSGEKCLSIGEGDAWKEYGSRLFFAPCVDGDVKQAFTIAHQYTENSHQLKTSSGLCVDAANADGPLAYECHNVEDDNRQQQFNVKAGKQLLWLGRTDDGDKTMCIDPAEQTAKLVVCAASADGAKPGQGFTKHRVSSDDTFQLKDMITDRCLTPKDTGSETHLVARPCGDGVEQLWTTNSHGNIINKGRDMCIDSGDQTTPLLYTCYPPGQNPKQSFKMHENGWIEIPRTWADNGRVRYLGKCFDTQPIEPSPLTVTSCGEATSSSWEMIWEDVPMETQMYLDASKVRGNLRANS